MAESQSEREIWTAVKNGFLGRCPKCRRGRMFRSYLKITDRCSQCGIELHHHRADDAPPYVTLFLVGHLIVPWVWWVEAAYRPSIVIHFALWLPLVIGLSLILLPAVKGAMVGMQWAMRMHGFALSLQGDDRTASGGDAAVADSAARQP